ncbi:hypothetical protein M2271_006692 [Streptomyces sp. LBL]|nr:hypothetical protein [Streptomyces sp. LBL]
MGDALDPLTDAIREDVEQDRALVHSHGEPSGD